MASASPAAISRSKPSSKAPSAASTQLITAPPPTRSVYFVTVTAASFSQLFATNCRVAIFLAAAASELTLRLSQTLQQRVDALKQRRQELEEKRRQAEAERSKRQQEEQKEQLVEEAAAGADAAKVSAPQQQGEESAELRLLEEEAARLQQEQERLSRVDDDHYAFDLRDTLTGTAMRLHESREAKVSTLLSAAAEYELIVAAKPAADSSGSTPLSFAPLSLSVAV